MAWHFPRSNYVTSCLNSSDYIRQSLLTIYTAVVITYTTCINIKESTLYPQSEASLCIFKHILST